MKCRTSAYWSKKWSELYGALAAGLHGPQLRLRLAPGAEVLAALHLGSETVTGLQLEGFRTHK